MKKIISLVLAVILIMSTTVFAKEEVLQKATFKNNVVFINGYSIPSVQLNNGYVYIWVDDLSNYGFDVKDTIADDTTGTKYKIFTVTRNTKKQIVEKNYSPDEELEIYLTKNIVYLESNTPANVYITQHNHTLMQCDELAKYGSFNWDEKNGRIDINIGTNGDRLPQTMKFHEVFGLNSMEDIKYATIEYVQELNNTVADVSLADLKEYLKECWDFNYDLVVEPYRQPTVGEYFINIWTDEKNLERGNNRIKHTIYGNTLPYGGYGKLMGTSGIESSYNFIWYKARGNAANALYTSSQKLYEKYKDQTREIGDGDGETLFWMNTNYLPLSNASEWAKPELQKAASHNFLPYDLTNNYQKAISRQEFCELAYMLISAVQGDKILDPLYEQNIYDNLRSVRYDDLEYPSNAIQFLSTVKIVNGMGDGTFNPEGSITREQAATILDRTAKYFNIDVGAKEDIAYSDDDSISDWAKTCVYNMNALGIMKGTDNGFEPQAKYTVEQAIATMVRLFEYTSK